MTFRITEQLFNDSSRKCFIEAKTMFSWEQLDRKHLIKPCSLIPDFYTYTDAEEFIIAAACNRIIVKHGNIYHIS